MENLFASPLIINESYDLKGSTVNRYLFLLSLFLFLFLFVSYTSLRSVSEKIDIWLPYVAMKDMDFHHRVQLGPQLKALFLAQVERDARV